MTKKTITTAPSRNFVMVGAGGTGSHLIHALTLYAADIPRANIFIWDADEVEEKNLKRQVFYPYEIGTNKAEAISARYPDICNPRTEYIGEDNIEKAIQDGDTVLICADNMAVRRLINAHAKKLKNITVINGGNEMYTGSVQVFIRRKGKSITPALDFFSPEFDIRNEEPDRAKMSCAEIAQLPGGEQTMLANNQVASFMLSALYRADQEVHGDKEQWTKVTFDMQAGIVQTSDVRLIGDWTK
jgi:molybdopterin/thiamine biosynthesis adenylyltransferase